MFVGDKRGLCLSNPQNSNQPPFYQKMIPKTNESTKTADLPETLGKPNAAENLDNR